MRDSIFDLLQGQSVARNSKRLREIIEFRCILEPEIAALAAVHVEPRDLERLRGILESQERSHAEGREDPDEDLHFHGALARITRNEVICEVSAVLHELLRECRVAPLQTPGRQRVSHQGHQRILEALAAKDPEQCRQAMRAHLEEIRAQLNESSPESSPESR